jgi:hypothetical protein
LESKPVSSESRESGVDNTSDLGYNNDISQPILIDMRQAKPLYEPHDHDYEHKPDDPDSHLGDIYMCRNCDEGIIVAR